MVFMRLDDVTGGAEVVVFNSVYAAARELIDADRVLVVKGRVDHKQEGETKLLAIEVSAFEAIPSGARCACGSTPSAPGRRDPRAGHADPRLPRRVAGLRRPRDLARAEAARARGRLPRAPTPDFYAEVKHLLGEAALV